MSPSYCEGTIVSEETTWRLYAVCMPESIRTACRYASPLLMALLREIARTTTSKLDWAAIQRKALPGLKSTRECQAIWRLIAYGAPIQGAFEDNAEPTVPSFAPSEAASNHSPLLAAEWVIECGPGGRAGERKRLGG